MSAESGASGNERSDQEPPRPQRPRSRWLRSAARAAAFGAVLGTVALAVGGRSVGARLLEQRTDTSRTQGTAAPALRAEIHAMVDAGHPRDDPKVQMIEEEVAALQALAETTPSPEADIDLDAVASGERLATASDGPDDSEDWDSGPVECEPIPHRLGVEDIAGAACFVEPRPGGGARYVAVAPDGTEHEVLFGPE